MRGDVVDAMLEMNRLAARRGVDLIQRRGNRLRRAAMTAARVRDQKEDSLDAQTRLPTLATAALPRAADAAQSAPPFEAFHYLSAPAHLRASLGDHRPSRRIVKTKKIAEFDLGIEVMPVVVFGEDDPEDPRRPDDRRRRRPAELARVPPPYVELAEGEPRDRSGGRKLPSGRCDQEVRDGA